MLSVIIQSLAFVIFIGVFLLTIKILNDGVSRLKWIFVSVLLSWLTVVVHTDLSFVPLLFLFSGVVSGIYGLILLSKEKDKKEKRKITSIKSAINSIIEKTGAKGIIVAWNDLNGNSKTVLKYGEDEECLMIIIPVSLSDGSVSYIALYGDKPFVNFKKDDLEVEISFVKLYIENLRLQEKIKLVKNDSIKVKDSIYNYIHLLSHELKKPLTVVIGFSEILRDEFRNLTEKDVIDFVTNIKRSGEEMLVALSYVGEIAEIETGKVKLNFERFKASEVVNDVLNYFAGEIGKKNLNVILEIDDVLEIEADRRKFREVVYQLVSNAVKFSDKSSSITIALTRRDGEFELKVKDEGIGIRPEDMDKIFKPFPRIKTHLNGTGLGLVLAKYLVELHGGKISFVSEYGKGSEFKVILPLEQNLDQFKKVAENCKTI
ncbi:MAG: HAMP domain-containing sensor histidine kinase [Candidatus Kryptonium sp.]|nr:HAMP domain-containing histidine kinase [Candidatus Kryptonium sp.]MCX7762155.1 HAMP domain-containing histidine kinase [Candidatus Kryptonium sp.]MDW8108995.1 HAMP domain-containing sensor histidine kinase [Candidatus Kryptonium sp.]